MDIPKEFLDAFILGAGVWAGVTAVKFAVALVIKVLQQIAR